MIENCKLYTKKYFVRYLSIGDWQPLKLFITFVSSKTAQFWTAYYTNRVDFVNISTGSICQIPFFMVLYAIVKKKYIHFTRLLVLTTARNNIIGTSATAYLKQKKVYSKLFIKNSAKSN